MPARDDAAGGRLERAKAGLTRVLRSSYLLVTDTGAVGKLDRGRQARDQKEVYERRLAPLEEAMAYDYAPRLDE
jgi:hypothetical protein